MGDWHERWQEGRIGFHKSEVHDDLIRYAETFLGSEPQRVLVPLCGKTLDLRWLAQRGHEVVGVELVPQAVREFFDEQELSPEQSVLGGLEVYRADKLSMICGDFFSVQSTDFGAFSRVWDRAALVALPDQTRRDYCAHVRALAPGGRLLQNAFEYNQSEMQGPPFSVDDAEIRSLYEGATIELLREVEAITEVPHFAERGLTSFVTRAYLLDL